MTQWPWFHSELCNTNEKPLQDSSTEDPPNIHSTASELSEVFVWFMQTEKLNLCPIGSWQQLFVYCFTWFTLFVLFFSP